MDYPKEHKEKRKEKKNHFSFNLCWTIAYVNIMFLNSNNQTKLLYGKLILPPQFLIQISFYTSYIAHCTILCNA